MIVEQILNRVRSGQLGPGDRLPPERELAEALGVSRVSLRDALRSLEAAGLVEIRVGAAGGAFVTVPDSDVLRSSFQNVIAMTQAPPESVAETRLVLELGLVDLVLERATVQDLKALELHCELEKDALENGVYSRELAQSFHVKLGELTHNPTLAIIAGTFRGALSMAELRSQEEQEGKRFINNVRDHRQVLDALTAGNREAVRHSVAHHLTRGLPARRRKELYRAFRIES